MNAVLKALRERVPRATLGKWKEHQRRENPLTVLRRQEATRIPDLLPIRHERMRRDPFSYYRGAAALAALDFADLPVTGLRAQICGDAHIMNFGAYASPERNLVFDVVDFDETLPGPWEWDVLRLCASIPLLALVAGVRSERADDAVVAAAQAYRESMNRYAAMDPLDVWYARIDVDAALRAEISIRASTQELLPTLESSASRSPRFADRPPLFMRLSRADERVELAHGIFRAYRASLPDHLRVLFDRYHVVDMAIKVVGVGSIGTLCLLALLVAEIERPLLIQIKEAQRSVAEQYLGMSRFANHGERVVVGQHLMQAASDLFLGWSSDGDRDFYVRQLRDMKGCLVVEGLRASTLECYARHCGATLARAHARSGEPRAIGGYLGKSAAFDEAMVRFARGYSVQCERDYAAFVAACARGEFAVAP